MVKDEVKNARWDAKKMAELLSRMDEK